MTCLRRKAHRKTIAAKIARRSSFGVESVAWKENLSQVPESDADNGGADRLVAIHHESGLGRKP